MATLHVGHDFEVASGAIERALALNDSCAAGFYFLAHIHAFKGDAALAEDYAVRALRLSPFDPVAFLGYEVQGCLRVRDQRFDKAASNFAKAAQTNPGFSWLHAAHAATLALAGRIEESKSVAQRVLELEPNYHVGPYEKLAPALMLPELWRPHLAGLRQAGLPE